MIPVLILAGGLGTRLGEMTKNIPKALVEVNGQPFMAWQLSYLKSQLVTDVTICTGHFSDQIEAIIGDGRTFGIRINYSKDGDRLIGTGGAIKKALNTMSQEQVFVIYGDSYLPIDMPKILNYYQTQLRPSLMTVLFNNNKWDQSNALIKHGIVQEYNKRRGGTKFLHIDYGLSIIQRRHFLKNSHQSSFDIADYFELSANLGNLSAYEVHERFYEVGSKTGLSDFSAYLHRTQETSLN